MARARPTRFVSSFMRLPFVSRGYVAFQMAEVAIPRILFADILRLIAEPRPPPAAVST